MHPEDPDFTNFGTPPGVKPAPEVPADAPLEERVVGVLKTVFDPEIPVDIHELGLVYEVDARPEEAKVRIVMTLTSPSCPAAQSLPQEVERKVRALDGVEDVDLQITWEPPWTPERMTEAARLQLGMI